MVYNDMQKLPGTLTCLRKKIFRPVFEKRYFKEFQIISRNYITKIICRTVFFYSSRPRIEY